MELIQLLMLLFILLFGAVTSYQDYKENKIRNKWILIALAYSLIVTLSFLSYQFVIGLGFDIGYLVAYLTNIAFSSFSAVLLWHINLWPAGDAKLFIAYSSLMHLSFYNQNITTNFPSFSLLVNTFLPLFLFYLIHMLFMSTSKQKKAVVKSMLNPNFIIRSSLFIFAFLWIFKVIAAQFFPYYIFITGNLFFNAFLMFLMMYLLVNLLKIDLLILSIIITILGVSISYEIIFTFEYLWNFSIILLLFIFVRYFVINLGSFYFSHKIYIEDLKPGMILAEDIHHKKGEYTKKRITHLSLTGALIDTHQNQSIFKTMSSGLTKEEVALVQKLHSNGKIKDHMVSIASTIPFAPFMFLGVIITILARGDIISIIASFI